MEEKLRREAREKVDHLKEIHRAKAKEISDREARIQHQRQEEIEKLQSDIHKLERHKAATQTRLSIPAATPDQTPQDKQRDVKQKGRDQASLLALEKLLNDKKKALGAVQMAEEERVKLRIEIDGMHKVLGVFLWTTWRLQPGERETAKKVYEDKIAAIRDELEAREIEISMLKSERKRQTKQDHLQTAVKDLQLEESESVGDSKEPSNEEQVLESLRQ
eukprot:1320484-Amorphochlora_amoeboformis.AAC.1